jgi:VWFA-related protein
LLVLAVCLTGPLLAQEQRPTFSSRSDLVVLRVSVNERKAGAVTGLDRGAFTVYDNGAPQEIAFFGSQDTPATIGILIDNSDSMHAKRSGVIAAALEFARASHPDDQMFVINFNEHVRSGLPAAAPFTSDSLQLRDALLQSKARGKTALHDAVLEALDYIERGTTEQKAIVLLSDGRDTASQATFERVLARAQASDAVIYPIGLTQRDDPHTDPDVLKKLARASGGEAHFPGSVEDLSAVLGRIARDIRFSYTIGFVPSQTGDTSLRALRVVVRTPDRRALTVRHRSGYVASSATARGPA